MAAAFNLFSFDDRAKVNAWGHTSRLNFVLFWESGSAWLLKEEGNQIEDFPETSAIFLSFREYTSNKIIIK